MGVRTVFATKAHSIRHCRRLKTASTIEGAGVFACAATYGYHLCQAHAFIDGNKRIAAVRCELFLLLYGYELPNADVELIPIFLSLAAGSVSRDDLEKFLADNAVELLQ